MYLKVEKKNFTIRRYVDNAIIYSQNCQKPPGRKFKLNNKVAIFTFSKFFYKLFFALSYVKK